MTNEVIKPDKKKAATPAAATEKKSSSPVRLIIFLIGLVALSAASMSGYLFLEMKNVGKGLDALRDTRGNLVKLENSLDGLRTANRKLQQSLAEQMAKQESIITDLASARKEERNDDRDWLLADIEHLLTIAVQRMTLDQDVTVALAAMQSADSRLRDYNDPELLPLRRQITADINSMQAVNPVDISGLALYLLDIAARAGQLPLKQPPADEQTVPAATDSKGEKSDKPAWRRFTDEVVESLKGLVKVYHGNEGSTISLMPEQRYYLYQNLRLQLETATRAVLHRETRNFHTSVEVIRDWLHDNFDSDNPAVSNIIDALARMSKIELQPELPDISSSLEAVKSIIHGTSDNIHGSDEPAEAPEQ